MVNLEKQQSLNDRKIDDAEDGIDRSNGGGDCSDDTTSTVDASSCVLRTNSSVSRGSAATTTEVLPEENGDVLLQQSDRVDNLVQWLRALDVQVIGACRADERLKPLLKLNASTGAAEDRLLSHLSQVVSQIIRVNRFVLTDFFFFCKEVMLSLSGCSIFRSVISVVFLNSP